MPGFFTVNSKRKYDKDETKSLFEQLEEGANQYTDIYKTVERGANLYAQRKKGEFEDWYPIHIAAFNIDSNTEAVNIILRTFTDPEARKKYLYLKNPKGRNVLEILLYEDEELAISSIVSLLSYLTAQEQKDLINSISKKARAILEDDETPISTEGEIDNFATLNYWLRSGHSIDMCKQRRNEAQIEYEGCDSDEESLGILDSVYNKKFTAKVSYKDKVVDGVVCSQPELMLIPSDWRLDTAIPDRQGDHVTAYVLLLCSFSHCKGESVKKLPNLVYDLVVRVLPNSTIFFEREKQKIDKELAELRKRRVTTIAALKAHTDQAPKEIAALKNTLKKSEIESIARYIEDTIDNFIKIINKLEGESFSQARKSSITKSYILMGLTSTLEINIFLKGSQYVRFKNLLLKAIQVEAKINPGAGNITDKDLKNIVKVVVKNNFAKQEIPKELSTAIGKLSKEKLFDFLKNNTPYKKYHEGYVIKNINEQISLLKQTDNQPTRFRYLWSIGLECFKLFDYPKVFDNTQNNVSILYEAIPRHWIIINAAFKYLETLPNSEKKSLYDAFIQGILYLQGWGKYEVSPSVMLDATILNECILKFAKLDENHNFSMQSEELLAEKGLTTLKM